MKVAAYSRNGPAGSVLELVSKPKMDPAPGEVLVRLETSGVNPSDVKSRAGRPLAFDFIVPHSDGAGLIEETGEGVDPSRVGERVWIWNGQWQRQYGTAAQFITLPQAQAVPLADNVSYETAACFGIPGLTAAHAVNLVSKQDHKTVLVTGAASSVGHYVTQMLVADDLRVIGTASSSKHDVVMQAGADAVIDYQNEDVAQKILDITNGAGVDAVVDMDFSTTVQLTNTSALAEKCTVYCYGSNDMGEIGVPFRDLLFKSLNFRFFLVYQFDELERSEAIARLNAFIESGKAVTRIAHSLPLSEIVQAHELVESGKASGNVILTLT